MNKIKDLNEKRGAKLKEASALSTDKAEDREKIQALHEEVTALDEQIVLEARQLELAGAKPVELSPQEERDLGRFDYRKLLNHLWRSAKGTSLKPLDGIEGEMVQQGETEARESGIESGGILLPRVLVRRLPGAERRDLTATGTTTTTGDQGGMTIATEKRGLLDDFFNASVIRAAGATVLEGLVGNLDLPRLAAGTAPSGKSENATADEVSPTTAMLSLSPNRLPAFIDISEQLLKQSSVAIEAIIRSHLTNQMVAVQEAAFFHGSGTNEANGVAGTSGIGSVAGGTNGAAPTLAHIIELETDVDTNNALLGNLRYISNGQIRGKLKQTAVVASTDSRMLLEGNGAMLNGYSALWTNAVSRTLTKGTATDASAIFFGNWSDYIAAYWGGIALELVRDATAAKTGMFVLVASTYYDGGVVRPKSFSAMLDALGA